MQTTRALAVPGLIALCAGFSCSSPSQDDQFFPTGSGTGGSSSSTGSTPGVGTGSGSTPGSSTGGSPGVVVGGGSMAGDAGIMKCTGTEQGTTPLPPVLEFLIDYSGSMNETPMGQTLPKYKATANALVQAFTDMADGTGTGLIFYPNTGGKGGGGTAGSCINKQEAVKMQTLNMTVRQQLITALNAKTTSGATPTHDAFVYAVDTLAASTLMGNKYVVLVTDGAPTYSLGCMGNGMTPADTAPLIQAVTDANMMRGIKTFVIGSPGSESARSSLSAMATQGGGITPPGCSDQGPTYCHFDMTTAPDLSAALNAAFKAITGSVITCNYTIPPPPAGQTIDPTLVNVNFTNSAGTEQVAKDPDTNGGCTKGWQYTANNTQIVLCPDMCDRAKADPAAKVSVVVGCKTMVR